MQTGESLKIAGFMAYALNGGTKQQVWVRPEFNDWIRTKRVQEAETISGSSYSVISHWGQKSEVEFGHWLEESRRSYEEIPSDRWKAPRV